MSKKSRRVPERIQDIRETMGNARSDLGSMTKEQFLANGKTQRAVIESIIGMGESANRIMRLDPGIEHECPAVWQYFKDAYEMRIVLTHEYFRIDAAVVWETIKNDPLSRCST
jgi:uncharacterized protein with HEPN domain